MNWGPTEVKHCIYVSIYRFQSYAWSISSGTSMHHFWSFKSKKYKFVISTLNTPSRQKKIIFKNIERKRFKKNPSRIQERNHTLQKTNRYIAAWYWGLFLRFFCLKWVVVDTFGDCGERKEKRRKETTKTKKHTKIDNWE